MGARSLDIEPAKVVFMFGSKVLSKAFGSASDDNGCSSHIKEGHLLHPLVQSQG